MKKNAMHRMLSMLSRGKRPDCSDLGISREEYVLLVSDAVEKGYVSGVYVSFCDNANDGNLLVQAALTEKGQAEAGATSLLKRIFHR